MVSALSHVVYKTAVTNKHTAKLHRVGSLYIYIYTLFRIWRIPRFEFGFLRYMTNLETKINFYYFFLYPVLVISLAFSTTIHSSNVTYVNV